MIKFTTASGAVYAVQPSSTFGRTRVFRLEGNPIADVQHPDGVWHTTESISKIQVGLPVFITWADGRIRRTSQVVAIEQVS